MLLWNRLWRDEAGVVLSAEAVMVGTVGVLGVVAGLSTLSHAVDDELKEVAFAIRSLDQSYAYNGHSSCSAWTAGSYYFQPKVETALADLCGRGEADVKAIQDRVDAYRKQTDSSSTPVEKPKPQIKPEKKKKAKKATVQIDESAAPQPGSNDLPADATAETPL
jgi:hypothetical protein